MYCGLDVAKNKSDVCILDKEKKVFSEFSITHTKEGFEFLEQNITPETKIGMEVTGNYSKTLFQYLRDRNYNISYVDNFRMNTFAKLHSPQVKNDKTDARLIALYVASPDELNLVDIPRVDTLKDLSNLYEKNVRQLTKYKSIVKDQINIIFPEIESLMSSSCNMGICYMLMKYPTPQDILNASDEDIRQALKENLKRAGRFDLEYAKKVKDLARNSIGIKDYPVTCFKHSIKTLLFYKLQNDTLKRDMGEIILKTPYHSMINEFGYNVVGLSTLIGIIGDIRRFPSHKKFASYCGFGIFEKRSGTSVNKSSHITKKGNARLRHTFHMMALIHLNYKTEASNYFASLKERGKHPNKCLVALARKLAVKTYYEMLKCHNSA